MWNHNSFGDIVADGDGDFVGYVAYCLYKEEKVKWIHHFHERTGSYPEPEQIDEYFTSFHSSPECITKYRDDAELMLNDYFNYCFAEELESFKKDLKDQAVLSSLRAEVRALDTSIKKTKKRFWVSVGEGTVSTIVASLLLIGLSFLLWFSQASSHARKELFKEAPIPEELKPSPSSTQATDSQSTEVVRNHYSL